MLFARESLKQSAHKKTMVRFDFLNQSKLTNIAQDCQVPIISCCSDSTPRRCHTDRSIAFAGWCQSAPPTNVNTSLLEPTWVCPCPNGVSIGSSVFAGLTVVTNTQTHTYRHTDHATVATGRHVTPKYGWLHAMRPKELSTFFASVSHKNRIYPIPTQPTGIGLTMSTSDHTWSSGVRTEISVAIADARNSLVYRIHSTVRLGTVQRLNTRP